MIPKFRAWDNKRKLMIDEVVVLDLYNEYIGYLYPSQTVQGEVVSRLPINDVIIMQSTGLKDKNGVEIFEGDILYIFQKGVISHNLEAHDENRKVVFFDGSWCVENYANTGEDFENFIIENHYPIGVYHTKDELEVIGNIYENIELLGED